MAPEGQVFWQNYSDDVILISVMVEGGSGGSPSASEINQWVSNYGITHPVLNDLSGSQKPYVVLGYPTFVVIDRNMVIQNADMWPWSDSYILGLI